MEAGSPAWALCQGGVADKLAVFAGSLRQSICPGALVQIHWVIGIRTVGIVLGLHLPVCGLRVLDWAAP